MKTMKKIFGLLLAILFCVSFAPVTEAGYVSGYTRKDGTYVSGYYRSSPNAYKYDNYSYDGGDLYNYSYYYPTKNYSSIWYTPSYYTDDTYYLGQSYYDWGY